MPIFRGGGFEMLPLSLFDFGYFPRWLDALDALEAMAQREPWRFPHSDYQTQNDVNPILTRYINSIYRRAADLYNAATDQDERDRLVTIRHDFAAFHTNLYTSSYTPILAYFVRNTRPGERRWYFRGWATPGSAMLSRASPLPQRVPFADPGALYNPAWPVRVNVEHILADEENLARIPPELRGSRLLPLTLETAVELARRKANLCPGIIQPQYYRQRVQLLLPISLTDPDRHDLALILQAEDGYYMGSTMLTIQMAYLNARVIGRPSAAWLYEAMEEGDDHDT